jgi:hypothetical protein
MGMRYSGGIGGVGEKKRWLSQEGELVVERKKDQGAESSMKRTGAEGLCGGVVMRRECETLKTEDVGGD